MTTSGWSSFSPGPHFNPWQKPAEWSQYQYLYNNARIIATPRTQMLAGVQYTSGNSAFYLRLPPVPTYLAVHQRVKNTSSITQMGRYYPTSTGWTSVAYTASTSFTLIGVTGSTYSWLVPYAYVAAASSWPDTNGTWTQVRTSAVYEGSSYCWPGMPKSSPTAPAEQARVGYPIPASNSHLSAVEYNALVDAAEQALCIPQLQFGVGSQSGYSWSIYDFDRYNMVGYVEFDPTWDHPSQEIVLVVFMATTSATPLVITVGGCPIRCTESVQLGYLHVYRASWFNKPVQPAMWFDRRPRYALQIAIPSKSATTCYSLGVYTHVRP